MRWALTFFIVTGRYKNRGKFRDIIVFWDMTPLDR
jgi:hypothetical protein